MKLLWPWDWRVRFAAGTLAVSLFSNNGYRYWYRLI